ncbi:MFS transporter [uncultured Tolumonas sp.]|uniref:MFS transporter n=1 Tax=uncultured Tolumonas sp. TaxID=263765 RepID=UPI002A0A97D9|nr:MFS transporter [uncultured Tolumonas sp.]
MLGESTTSTVSEENTANWGAVYAMSLCVFALITSEFLPVSLLTPIASDLMMTEGQAGQSITVSGIFAVVTSLYIALLSKNQDRKIVMISLTVLMIVSGSVITFAPNYYVLMLGRALLGIVIGGFWSLSTATLMRLLPASELPKGLVILNAGNALAATIAAPVGSFLGAHIGWRGAFFCIVPIALISLIWQLVSFPSMQAEHQKPLSWNVFNLLGRLEFLIGMLAVLFLFMGQFALFTYLRPFLETVTNVNVSQLSVILLVLGLSGFIGTLYIGKLLRKILFPVLIIWPCILALTALGLILFGAHLYGSSMLIAIWGFIGTSSSVGWYVWLAKVAPNDSEQGGGILIAIIQLAITLGAGVGGLLYDSHGYQASFGSAGILLFISAVFSFYAARLRCRAEHNEKERE